MKLLFDANLSYRLVKLLTNTFQNCKHVRDVGLESAGDEVIWNYAATNGFLIVSKDTDFRHWSFLFGAPPKVISIKRGNCSTTDIQLILEDTAERIKSFYNDPEESVLILE